MPGGGEAYGLIQGDSLNFRDVNVVGAVREPQPSSLTQVGIFGHVRVSADVMVGITHTVPPPGVLPRG